MNAAVQPLDPEQQARARAILRAADLPVPAHRTEPVTLYGLIDEEAVLGVAGLERYESDGLLRSVAVPDGYQGRGYGREVVSGVETIAAELGVETVYLLTTTAAAFFDHLGYHACDRAAVPESIRATREFSETCPGSAVCMTKRL